MRVFVSWSGSRSHQLAKTVRDWLQGQGTGVEAWLSSDMPKGVSWSDALLDGLAGSTAVILCITSEAEYDWMAFETGAVVGSTAVGDQVFVLLLDADVDALAASPLADCPSFAADRDGLAELARRLGVGAGAAAEPLDRALIDIAAIGAPAVRDFEISFVMPEGSVARPVAPLRDMDWLPAVAGIADALRGDGLPIGAHDFSTFHHLDLDHGTWLPMPKRLSSISTAQLALVHPQYFEAWYGNARLAAEVLKSNARLHDALASRDRRVRIDEASAFLYGFYLLQLPNPGLTQGHVSALLKQIQELSGLPRSWTHELPARFLADANMSTLEAGLGNPPGRIRALLNLGFSLASIRDAITHLGRNVSFVMLARVLSQFRQELLALDPPADIRAGIVARIDRMAAPAHQATLEAAWEALLQEVTGLIKWLADFRN